MQTSIFTKIMDKEIPAHVLYEDGICIAILTIEPHNPGHSLIIPRKQIEDWQNLDEATFLHCMKVAKALAKILDRIYHPKKMGIATVGFEIAHVHIHLIPLYKISDIDHTKAKPATPEQLEIEARKIRKMIEEDNLKGNLE